MLKSDDEVELFGMESVMEKIEKMTEEVEGDANR